MVKASDNFFKIVTPGIIDGYLLLRSGDSIGDVDPFYVRWGQYIENSDSTCTIDAEDINTGLLLLAGRNGVQDVVLPTEGVNTGASILIIGYEANVSDTNYIRVIGASEDGYINSLDGKLGYIWAKTRWIEL